MMATPTFITSKATVVVVVYGGREALQLQVDLSGDSSSIVRLCSNGEIFSLSDLPASHMEMASLDFGDELWPANKLGFTNNAIQVVVVGITYNSF
ncbi:hypothetical protein M8C21_030245 [Ambrosia artemisiifolia]|uniref:Uncharacterized protein n=1 Tax=Ambrosia artemisiifolia TaxID=4212 RepID=A0AAD5GKH8_AMBAR|nr:hypothetical protein M8C21_030245 [Ambrosia artemisiifolia]